MLRKTAVKFIAKHRKLSNLFNRRISFTFSNLQFHAKQRRKINLVKQIVYVTQNWDTHTHNSLATEEEEKTPKKRNKVEKCTKKATKNNIKNCV